MSEVRGFCRTKEQEAGLKAAGLPPRAIFMVGRGAESLDHCLESFRDRGGVLVLAGDLRILAGTKRQVAETMARLEKLNIKVTDLTNPGDTTVAQQVQRAHVLISGSRFHGDRKRAKKMGHAGGTARGKFAWDRRDSLAPRWLVDRIVDAKWISWDQKVLLLAPHFTEASLRRHYGIRATKAD